MRALWSHSSYSPSLGGIEEEICPDVRYAVLLYFYFFIETDGTLRYDLWCSPEKAKNKSFLSSELADLSTYVLDDMKKCPKLACGCNYNYSFHDLYLRECRQRGYPQNEIFFGNNLRIMSKIKRIFSKIKTSFWAS